MKTNNLTIVSLLNVLNSYANKRLPQKIAFAITKNISIIDKEYRLYEEQLKKIISDYDRYIEKDENDKNYILENGFPKINDKIQNANFTEELNDLLSVEIEINLFTIDEKVFDYEDSDKYTSLTPAEIMQLQSILCIKE